MLAGGITQTSTSNLTLYSSAIVLRLLGEPVPHEEILSRSHRVLSSYLFWGVEANIGGVWTPLSPESSNFTIIGTNSTGTFVIRTMIVGFGPFSGVFSVVYKAIASGPLKWDLVFSPATPGQYKLGLTWLNVTNTHWLSPESKQFRVGYGVGNYTLDWSDISSFNTTNVTVPGGFALSVDIGTLNAGSTIMIDPSIVGTTGSPYDTFQRHVFYEPSGGYYWVFYYDGNNNVYRNSPNGLQWSASTTVPSGVNGQPWYDPPYNPDVFNFGQTVVLVGASDASGTCRAPCSGSNSLLYVIGTISGSSISWGPVQTEDTITRGICPGAASGTYCSWDISMTYVDVVRSATGQLAFSYLLNVQDGGGGFCSSGSGEVALILDYNGGRLVLACPYTGGSQAIVLPSNSQGQVRIIYPTGGSSGQTLQSRWFDGTNSGSIDSLGGMHGTVGGGNAISAVSDENYGIHVVFRGANNNASYAYLPSGSGSWSYSQDIFSVPVSFATITADYSTNEMYAFGINGSSIVMKSKAFGQNWSDSSTVYAVTGRVTPSAISSNFASASATTNNQTLLVWAEYNQLLFASIPLQTVWSPYSAPPDPWNGNGLAPYGQYFANLGEYVSPSTGMLTIKQTDLTLPGRGLSLDITRVYTEPYSFLNSQPLNYEAYPWAPMGDGWQLNFPWLSGVTYPLYVHLWDGEGYRIPLGFWSGSTATLENHQGENFRLVRYVNGTIVLFDKSGTSYRFGIPPNYPNHALTSITDSTGNNTITLNYSNNVISCISDTVQRASSFSYSGGFLQKISQVNGSCASPGSSIRTVTYGNNGASLMNVTDPANRVTTYLPGSNPWLIARITYPTGWYDSYSYYPPFTLGTQATTYRVSLQQVMAGSTSTVRQFAYSYAQGAGDQITGSTVTSYNGTQVASYTKYAFSFLMDVKNATDASGNLLRGNEQVFGVNGQIPKEIVFVTDGQGHIGSYTNYYSYDLWGNQIYGRQVINPSSNLYHESFNSYYNNAEPPGFYAFEDSFSRNQGTAPDNSWNVANGYWMVNNGVYNGAPTSGPMESVVAYSSVNKTDASIQTRVFLVTLVNTTVGQRFGIFTHYTGDSLYHKWALVIHSYSSVSYLELLDENNQWLGNQGQPGGQSSAVSTCSAWTIPLISTGVWYTFNMTVHGTQASGWASAPGQPSCSVTGTFQSTSPAINGARFGLYASTYSALFDDVKVATVSPYITSTGFSNSFIQSGAPGPIGLNTWLATAKPPGPGWNTTVNWLAASAWSQAYTSQNYGAPPWGTLTGWPDNSAQWIWASTNSNVSASIGAVWFRRTFSVPTTSTLNVAIATDDTYVVYLDGSKLGTGSNWHQVGSYTSTVSPGYHMLAINATNTAGPAGLLVSVKNSGTGQILFRSDATAGPNIPAVAGLAQLQNGAGSPSEETYYGYVAWGGVSQTKQFYTPTGGSQWLSTSRTYDSYGNLKTLTDARGNTTSYGYSLTYHSAYLTSANQTLAPGGTLISQRYSYNFTTGTMIWAQQPNGYNTHNYNTTYTYDILGRPTKVTYPTGDFLAYTYNDAGNYVNITNENSLKTKQIYDGLGRLASTQRFVNGVVYSTSGSNYNWMNEVTSSTDPLGSRYSYTYDALGRMNMTIEPNSNHTQAFYNGIASWVRYADEYQNSRCSIYDRLGRLVSVIEEADTNCQTGIVTNYYYDEAGDLIEVRNANQAATFYTYDSLSRLIQTTKADGTTDSYIYDSNGNVVRKVDQNTVKTLLSYDSLNRPLTVTYCGSPVTSLSYTYDSNGNILSLQNQNATVSYIYDSRNRPLNETYAVNQSTRQIVDLGCSGSGGTSTTRGGGSKTYTFTYSYSGELLSGLVYPTTNPSTPNIAVNYAYDSLGRVLSVSSPYVVFARFSYYPNDAVKGIQYGNGLLMNYTYDRVSRISLEQLNNTSTHTTLLRLAYAYNNTGTVASILGQVNQANVNEQYRYDPLQRLVSSSVTSQATNTQLSYTYDNVGNRLSQTLNGTTTSYSYNNANNELISAGAASYAYDANGNLLTKTVGSVRWTYTWDVANQLLKVVNGTTQGIYAYDGNGRMLESIEGSQNTYFAYMGTATLWKNGTDYIYAGARLVAFTSDNLSYRTPRYYHTDALGSVRLMTKDDTTVFYSDGYQPYGQDNGKPYCPSCPTNPQLKFTGKPVSQGTGLYYYYHRWSDPSIGRFISPDPKQGSLENPQTLNLYVYVADSPLNNNDPSGEFINIVIGAVAGGLIGWAACGFTTGAWFSTGCGEAALVGAGTGALAGATFGLSLGVMGVGEAGATIGQALVAGTISGTISGIANFDLNSLFGLEKPTWDNFVKDAAIGAVSGFLGGALGDALGGVKGESLDPRNLGKELQDSGQAFLNVVSPKVQAVAKLLGDTSASSMSFSSGTAKVVVGTGVELGKALLTGVIDPGLHRLAQFFSW